MSTESTQTAALASVGVPRLVRLADAAHADCMFAARLSALREMRGLTQEEVAQRSGLKPAAVSHFENARRRPCLLNLMRLCMALRCTPNDLLLEPNNQEQPTKGGEEKS